MFICSNCAMIWLDFNSSCPVGGACAWSCGKFPAPVFARSLTLWQKHHGCALCACVLKPTQPNHLACVINCFSLFKAYIYFFRAWKRKAVVKHGSAHVRVVFVQDFALFQLGGVDGNCATASEARCVQSETENNTITTLQLLQVQQDNSVAYNPVTL